MKITHPDKINRIKALVASSPLLGPVARGIARIPAVGDLRRRFGFKGSSHYWEERYQQGGTSGSGSFGRLAQFKAEILNDWVKEKGVKSVIEFGCGDGEQLALARYPRYVGVDVARGSIEACRRRFSGDSTKRFYLATELPPTLADFDLVLSLDVIYHLVEDQIYENYMRSLFVCAGRFVAIYSSNMTAPSDAPHVRHRLFTQWITVNKPQWEQVGFVRNTYPFDASQPEETSFADFYFFELTTCRSGACR